MSVVGEEHLHAARAQGSGTILLSVHLGDFDLAGAWLAARHELTPVVVGRALEPRWREALFTYVRRRCGVIMRDAGTTRLKHLEHDVRSGRTVLVMLDRRSAGPTTMSVLLGRPAVAPVAVAALAARTGALLLPAATWRGEHGETVAWFGRPIRADTVGQAADALAACTATLGNMIRDHPEQWHVPADRTQLAWGGETVARGDASDRLTEIASERRLSA